MGILAALFGFFALVAGLSFLAAYVIMLLLNIVVSFFGGPHITYWVVLLVIGC